MSHSSKLTAPPVTEKKAFSPKNLFSFIGQWTVRNKIYFLAFIIPVIIMYAAYALFKIYPFGDESVLVLDLNGQYAYYFEALRDALHGDGSALYSWSRNLSGGFMGVIGYYLASPFTLIVMLLPRTMLLESLLIMMLSKIGSAAVAFSYYLQKSKGIKPLPSVIFSTLYALMAYGVIQLMNPMWLDGLIFLPLVMLGVEYMIDDGRKLNYIIPLAIMFVANFYIGFMMAIFTALYFIFYLVYGSDKKVKSSLDNAFVCVERFVVSTIAVLLCSAFMLLPVYNALKLGKFDFSDPDYSFTTQFNPIDFIMQLCVGQYDSVNPEKNPLPEIYCGILTIVLLPMFYFNKNISKKKKAGYSLFIFIMFICMYIKPIDMMWHGGQEPNWLPFRYSFMLSFLLLSMAAIAFVNLDGIKPPAIIGSAIGVMALLGAIKLRNVKHISGTEILIAVGLVVLYGGILVASKYFKRISGIVMPLVILIGGCGETLYNAYDTLKSEDGELSYSTRSSWYDFINNGRATVRALKNHDESFYRAEKTYQRMVNDNQAIGLNGLSHSSSVMNAKILKFMEAAGYSVTTYYSTYSGGTPVSDSLLGIKYILDKRLPSDEQNNKGLVNKGYEYIGNYEFSGYDSEAASEIDQVVDFYENKNALSIGYMADEDIQKIASFGNDNPFRSQNLLLSTLSGNTVIDLNDPDDAFKSYAEYFKPLNVNPDDFVLNNVTSTPYDTAGHIQYSAAESGDPTVNMFITSEGEGDIFMFFKTEHQKAVNLWLSTEQDETGEYINHKFVKTYFENHDYHIINLGSYEPGTTFNLRMTVANEFTVVKDFFFYQLDEELFQSSMDMLKAQQWDLTPESGGRKLEGTIEAGEGQIMMTSIPYEPGWKVKVDGKTVDTLFTNVEQPDGTFRLTNSNSGDTGQLIIADAFIGIRLTPGKHTVEMTYTPPGLIIGIFALIAGIAFIVLIYRYDKKNNKTLIALKTAKTLRNTAQKPQSEQPVSTNTQETVQTPASKQTAKKKKRKKH